MIIPDHVGWLLTENRKQNMSNFLPKNWSWTLHKKFTGLIRESSWNSIWLRNKTVIYKVVTYGRWSLTRSGGYERIDCTDLNVQIMSAGWRVAWEVKELKFSYSRTLEPCKLDIVLHILLTTVDSFWGCSKLC